MRANEPEGRWHVSKAIDIGNILAIVTVIVAGIAGFINFDRRISILEINQNHIVQQQERDRNDMKDKLDSIQESVEYIRKELERSHR